MEKRELNTKPKARSRSSNEWVVITGISGNIGRRLAKYLHKHEAIIGIDSRSFPDRPKDILHFDHELWRKRTESIFRSHKIKAVYHISIMHNPRSKTRAQHTENIMGIARLLEYCKRYEIPKVVVLSSTLVYGALPDNDSYLTEEAPLRGGRNYTEVRDLIEVDMLAQSYFWKAPKMQVIILRPVHVVGKELKNTPTNYLKLDPVPMPSGFDPMVQLIHVEDVVRAMASCLEVQGRGVFNIVGSGAAPLRSMLHSLNKRVVNVPLPILKKVSSLEWKLGVSNFPPQEIFNLCFSCMVDGSRAEQVLSYKASLSLRDTLERVVDYGVGDVENC